MLDMHMRGVKNEPSDNEEQNLAISKRRRALECQKEMPRGIKGCLQDGNETTSEGTEPYNAKEVKRRNCATPKRDVEDKALRR
jgi:hypothetical protein